MFMVDTPSSSLGSEFGLSPIPKIILSENWHSSDKLEEMHQTFFKVFKDNKLLKKILFISWEVTVIGNER